MNAKKFRNRQTIASIIIFIFVFFMCWIETGFNLEEIQLSKWGIINRVGMFWNFCLILLSISIYLNTRHYIITNKRLYYTKVPKIMFFLVSISLFLTGIINMNYTIHSYTALFYFYIFPLSIFWLAHLNRKYLKYSEWLTHTSVSACMIIVPFILLKVFDGMAMAEILHSLFVVGWSVWILIED